MKLNEPYLIIDLNDSKIIFFVITYSANKDYKLIKNVVMGATSIQENQITNPPKIAPRLLPLPPTITIIQTIKVKRSGL